MNIISQLRKEPEKIKESDIQWIIPELLGYYAPKMHGMYRYAYSITGNDYVDVAKKAFIEKASDTLEKGIRHFYFKSQHWRSGRDIDSYLISCLTRLSKNIREDVLSSKKTSVPVCPACKSFNQREYLVYDGKMLRCEFCLKEQDSIEDRIKSVTDDLEKNKLYSELRLRQIFAMHSRAGYRCPDCNRFIPKSFVSGNIVSCPYDYNCEWFGDAEDLEKMIHPMGITGKEILVLDENVKIGNDSSELTIKDTIASADITPQDHIEFLEKCNKELNVLREVIETQSKRLNLEPEHRVIKKKLMYQAFSNMLDKNPHDMITYLVHQHHSVESPIQARIFQEFIYLVENSLPIQIMYNGSLVDIYTIQDPRLDLFLGLSEFSANVRADLTIPNNTLESYIGGRKSKDFGPCFIGQLVDIISVENNQSILDLVDFYTFSKIKMQEDVPVGLKVHVKHFRIPSHYEMNGLVYLQRIRRKVVDSVYFRLHKKRRKIK